jgi:hypothetical protein
VTVEKLRAVIELEFEVVPRAGLPLQRDGCGADRGQMDTSTRRDRQMPTDQAGLCSPGTRVEVIGETLRPAVVLYVGSDAKVLVCWEDQSTSVLPQELLALPRSEHQGPGISGETPAV